MRLHSLKNIVCCALYHVLFVVLTQAANFRAINKSSSTLIIHSGMCLAALMTLSAHASISTGKWRWLTPDRVNELLFATSPQPLTDLSICVQLMISTNLIFMAVGSLLMIASQIALAQQLLMIYRYWTALNFAANTQLDRKLSSTLLSTTTPAHRKDNTGSVRLTDEYRP